MFISKKLTLKIDFVIIIINAYLLIPVQYTLE